MTEQDFNKLKQVIKTYRDKKTEVYNRVADLEKEVREGRRYAWVVDEMKNELYRDLTNCPERKAFIEESEKTKTDPEFEKYFRSAAMEYFLGIKIRPENL